MDQIEPWTKLAKRPSMVKANIDQRATGLTTTDGLYIKKPTELRANDLMLLQPFKKFKCNGNRVHAQACNRQLALAAIYTPRMQAAFVEAVRLMRDKSKCSKRGNMQAFPVDYGFDLNDFRTLGLLQDILYDRCLEVPGAGHAQTMW